MPRRQRTMKGGFLDSIANSLTNAWESTKKASSNAYNSATGSTPTYTPTYTPTPVTPTTPTTPTTSGYMGGKKRKRTRRMRGGYSDNMSLTGLAASAAPISGIESAKPHTIVGGKRRTKKRHRHSKSCRNRKH